jgi:signal peptidase I
MGSSTAVDGTAGGGGPEDSGTARLRPSEDGAGAGRGAAPGAGAGPGRLGGLLSGGAVAVGLVLLLGGFVLAAITYQPFAVPSNSMDPTVRSGDRLLAQRVDGGEVRRGDIVVFNDAVWGDVPMLKRVVAVGGDTVACCDERGRLTVNGEAVDEAYLDGGRASPDAFDAKVPQDRLFLLGDNRNTSLDSRTHLADQQGTVPRSAVTARVDGTAWPLDRMGFTEYDSAFAEVGAVSSPGPLRWLVAACAGGALLILGGAAAGPVSARLAGRRARRA